MRHKVVKQLNELHKANQWQEWDLNPGKDVSKPEV
jgi:hypothetical protein